MKIGIRRKANSLGEYIEIWTKAYTQTKIPLEELCKPPYSFVPVEVPSEYVPEFVLSNLNSSAQDLILNNSQMYEKFITDPKFVKSSDFNDDLTFSQEKYNIRLFGLETEKFRQRREEECFPVINRGKLWYETLTDEQVVALKKWYQDWLDVTDTRIVPEKPEWLKSNLQTEHDLKKEEL